MATQVIKTTFQLKRGLAEAWSRNNPVLQPGEPGWTLDTHVLKIGDGSTPWNDLTAVNTEISEDAIQQAVDAYLEAHPIVTDASLTEAGKAADAGAVREMCLFNSDQLVLCAGDADDNIFTN